MIFFSLCCQGVASGSIPIGTATPLPGYEPLSVVDSLLPPVSHVCGLCCSCAS